MTPTTATTMIIISILVVFFSPNFLVSAANLLIAIQVEFGLIFFNTFLEDLLHMKIKKPAHDIRTELESLQICGIVYYKKLKAAVIRSIRDYAAASAVSAC